MQTKLTFLPGDSHANHTAAQGKGSAKKMNAIYGQKCLEQYERFPRVSSWAKMFAASLIGMEGWYSTRCALNWKLLGIKSRPVLYLRAVSMHHIDESECGLLPTPTAMQDDADVKKVDARNEKQIAMGNPPFILGLTQRAKRGMLPTPTAMDSTSATANMKSTQVKEGSMHSVTLSRAMLMGLLPTPQASDVEGGVTNPKHIQQKNGRYVVKRQGTGTEFGAKLRDVAQLLPTPRANKVNGLNLENNPKLAGRNKSNLEEIVAKALLPTPNAAEGYKGSKTYNPNSQMGSGLSALAVNNLLPTPTASDKNQGTPTVSDNFPRHTQLNHLVSQQTGQNSQLNPQFVAEMMGFPPNWTELPFLSGELNQSKPTEMP